MGKGCDADSFQLGQGSDEGAQGLVFLPGDTGHSGTPGTSRPGGR